MGSCRVDRRCAAKNCASLPRMLPSTPRLMLTHLDILLKNYHQNVTDECECSIGIFAPLARVWLCLIDPHRERECVCCLLVLNSVTSTPQWIRQMCCLLVRLHLSDTEQVVDSWLRAEAQSSAPTEHQLLALASQRFHDMRRLMRSRAALDAIALMTGALDPILINTSDYGVT
jgi:hypothetical protein